MSPELEKLTSSEVEMGLQAMLNALVVKHREELMALRRQNEVLKRDLQALRESQRDIWKAARKPT